MNTANKKRVDYRAFILSKEWKRISRAALKHYGKTCNRCKGVGTHVHHKTYERFGGAELLSDLEVLCKGCHRQHHALERATRLISRMNCVHVAQKA